VLIQIHKGDVQAYVNAVNNGVVPTSHQRLAVAGSLSSDACQYSGTKTVHYFRHELLSRVTVIQDKRGALLIWEIVDVLEHSQHLLSRAVDLREDEINVVRIPSLNQNSLCTVTINAHRIMVRSGKTCK